MRGGLRRGGVSEKNIRGNGGGRKGKQGRKKE